MENVELVEYEYFLAKEDDYVRGLYDENLLYFYEQEFGEGKVTSDQIKYNDEMIEATRAYTKYDESVPYDERFENLADAYVALQTRDVGADLFKSIVFNVGLGYLWIREWTTGVRYGAPSLYIANVEYVHEFANHPAVVSSREREYAELFTRALILPADIPKEVDRSVVYDIAVLYGCTRDDLLCLISNARVVEGDLVFGRNFRMISAGSMDPLFVPQAYVHDIPSNDKCVYVPSLREMCCAVLPFGAGNAASAEHYHKVYGQEEPPCPNVEPGYVSYFDFCAQRPVIGRDNMLSQGREGFIFKRGSAAAMLMGFGRATGDVDYSFRAPYRPAHSPGHTNCDINCNFARAHAWMIGCGAYLPLIKHGVARAKIDPSFFRHRHWCEFFLTCLARFAYAGGADTLVLNITPVRVYDYVYGGNNDHVRKTILGRLDVINGIFENKLKTTSFGYVALDEAFDLKHKYKCQRVPKLVRKNKLLTRPNGEYLGTDCCDNLYATLNGAYHIYRPTKFFADKYPTIPCTDDYWDALDNYVSSETYNPVSAEKAIVMIREEGRRK